MPMIWVCVSFTAIAYFLVGRNYIVYVWKMASVVFSDHYGDDTRAEERGGHGSNIFDQLNGLEDIFLSTPS